MLAATAHACGQQRSWQVRLRWWRRLPHTASSLDGGGGVADVPAIMSARSCSSGRAGGAGTISKDARAVRKPRAG